MIKSPRPIEIIILAAGNSSRLGQSKQLVEINKQSLLLRQCLLALEFTDNVSCVFGDQYQKMVDEIADLPVKYIINENWQQGLASSIAKGVSALNSNTQAVMLLLVDQWQLGIDELTLFIRKWQKKPEYIYTASNDTGIKGPPVIFPQHCFSDLSQLKRGHGAKSVIDQHTKILRSIRMPAAFIDLDTPKQLTELKKLYNTN